MKKGSALLVVLGMMAFIVVSAIAFSAYMRYSRMPSSYLRRTSSSRLLVKAALAEAINAVDVAIGNNPYPGVGGNNANRWQSRVFMGSDTSSSTDDTVSTLTMEGLAYIPPAFINEVRYYSRRTPTAEWQTLNYDAGRFAYCAVDVSDCFDINRLSANVGRDSSDANRITLSHCFENAAHTGYSIQPSAWDQFIDKYSNSGGSGSKIPLVSVADLNLAINAEGGLDDLSPFCAYLKQSGNARMVTSDSDTDKKTVLQRNLAFVTDTCFHATNTVNANVIDLSRQSDQPFYGMRMMKASDVTKNADTFNQMVDGANQKFRNVLSVPEVAQLYDYLDRDSVPLSLALPTTERVPMVTGVGLSGSLSLSVQTDEQESPVGQKNKMTGDYDAYVKITAGALTLAGELGVKVGLVYPFKRDRGTSPSFKAQAAATVTLVPAGSEKLLRRSAAVSPVAFARGDWTTSKKNPSSAKLGNGDVPVVMTMMSETKSVTVKKKAEQDEDAVSELSFNFQNFKMQMIAELEDDPLMNGATFDEKYRKTTFRKIVRRYTDGQTPTQTKELHTKLRLPNEALSNVRDLTKGDRYVPVVQVWVRVIDENDKTVDLVPAYYKDDETASTRLTDLRSAAILPLLRFSAKSADDAALTYDDTVFTAEPKETVPYPQAYLADDPRFNFAPENLMAVESLGGDFKTEWLKTQRSASRDGDIFMATSDAGYLQSVYELSFINDMKLATVNAATYNGNIRTSFGDTPANEAMWTTYSQVKLGDSNGGEIDDILPFVENGSGFRVNPYTDDVNVLMAALANTPMDWWAASTNDVGDAVKKAMANKLTEASKYTFSQFASDDELKVKHGTVKNYTGTLTELAQQFMSAFRNAGSNWQNAFDRTVNWNEEDKIAGVDLGVTLHSVDKKYLHGFWRGCFANKQHLFLIFVRAEPMMMGGGGQGQTPPQLGARAVALVWRDPTENRKYPSGPHRTRILFYRQFD